MARVEVGDRALGIVLPVGISFFTFQSLSYHPALLTIPALLFALHALAYSGAPARWCREAPDWLFAAGYGAVAAVAASFSPLEAAPFIYFQF